ncbi:hypothetical protein C8R47DRAFT_963349 [Mycena vitilis]|nr:hypothetical protein C8R47DRAFT_963349 [Mycena vitilis]
MEETAITAIPNGRHLIPDKPHPAHTLFGGWLLHEDAATQQRTYLCMQCKRKLSHDERPPLALANGMWIGQIPFELRILTLPERLLVSLYFPAAYVVKLYPKVKGARTWTKEMLNSGMKGNVSTYKLNTAQIAGIVSGNTMPPSPVILAATIGVTFVGAGNTPLRILPDFLRVRRKRVFDALLWLKRTTTCMPTSIYLKTSLGCCLRTQFPRRSWQTPGSPTTLPGSSESRPGTYPWTLQTRKKPRDWRKGTMPQVRHKLR